MAKRRAVKKRAAAVPRDVLGEIHSNLSLLTSSHVERVVTAKVQEYLRTAISDTLTSADFQALRRDAHLSPQDLQEIQGVVVDALETLRREPTRPITVAVDVAAMRRYAREEIDAALEAMFPLRTRIRRFFARFHRE